MKIPTWANQYFFIQNSQLMFRFPNLEPDLVKARRYFRDVKKIFRERLSGMEAYNPYPTDLLVEYATTYLLCNLGMGYMDYQLRILRGGSTSSRQHWIPKTYLESFEDKGLVRKIDSQIESNVSVTKLIITPELLAEVSSNFANPKSSKLRGLISTSSKDFCEEKENRGTLYPHHFEYILSKIEADYSVLDKQSHPVKTVWDSIVIMSFFLIFSTRVKEKFQIQHPSWANQEKLMLELFPRLIANLEVISIETPINLPFTQHPLWVETEPNDFSVWSIYTPNRLLWFRHVESKYTNDQNDEFFLRKICAVLNNTTSKNLYFHPEHPVWKFLL